MVKKRRINRKTFRLVLLPATAVVILMASAGVAMHRYPYTVRYEVSHNSQEGIEGAQAIAAAIFLSRTGHSKNDVKKYIEDNFHYDLDTTVSEHRKTRSKDYVCSQSGPEAIRCWLEADTYEQTIRNAVTLRTDADTVADIAGAIAASTPGMEVPQAWADKVFGMLDDELKGIFVRFDTSLKTN